MKIDNTYVFSKNLSKLLGIIEDFTLPTCPLPMYRFYIHKKLNIQDLEATDINCDFDHLILELNVKKLTEKKEFVLALKNDEDYNKLSQVEGFKII